MLGLLAALATSGCGTMDTPKVVIHEPTSARPTAPSAPGDRSPGAIATPAWNPNSGGAIFSSSTFRPLLEDRKARLVGDTLTISIDERMSAKSSSNSTVDRSGKIEAGVSAAPFLSTSTLGKLSAKGSSSNSFEGKGETGSNNAFSGTIAVTVIEVLANGNLIVAGEKQVGINQNVEVLRFSGVVNPSTVQVGNTVSSTQVADARLEVRGKGDANRAQTTGWLSRFFLSWFPI
jgi:flagellar L-ring protein precursor FlgH